MPTKRYLQEKLDQMIRAYDQQKDWRQTAEDEAQELRHNIRDEIRKHTPNIRPGFWMQPPGGAQKRIPCSDPDCPFFWPCPSWKMLRRIQGFKDDGGILNISMEQGE